MTALCERLALWWPGMPALYRAMINEPSSRLSGAAASYVEFFWGLLILQHTSGRFSCVENPDMRFPVSGKRVQRIKGFGLRAG